MQITPQVSMDTNLMDITQEVENQNQFHSLPNHPVINDLPNLNALTIGEVHWWTTDQDIAVLAASVGVPIQASRISFLEHKVNGKSKGFVYIECGTHQNALRLKSWLDANDFQGRRLAATFVRTSDGNPFRTLPKEPISKYAQNQVYNSNPKSINTSNATRFSIPPSRGGGNKTGYHLGPQHGFQQFGQKHQSGGMNFGQSGLMNPGGFGTGSGYGGLYGSGGNLWTAGTSGGLSLFGARMGSAAAENGTLFAKMEDKATNNSESNSTTAARG